MNNVSPYIEREARRLRILPVSGDDSVIGNIGTLPKPVITAPLPKQTTWARIIRFFRRDE